MEIDRPSWDEYWLNIAEVASTRSVCLRNHVGSVIVKNKEIISLAYNGAPAYQPNCQEIGYCYRDRNKIKSGTNIEKCRASGSHGESNAISLAAKNGHSTDGATIYIVGQNYICNVCRGMISNAGIKKVILKTTDGIIHEYFPEKDWTENIIDKE